MFDMDAMRDEILEKEKQTEKTTSESVVHRSDNIIAKKRRELNDIPVVSAASLLSPDEARKLKSFSNKTKHDNKTKSKIIKKTQWLVIYSGWNNILRKEG